jgi:hypothetical protein
MIMTIVNTRNIKTGDTVYADYTRYSTVDVRQGTVINVSPTGVIKVDFGKGVASFQPTGWERGANQYDRAFLIPKERYDRSLVQMNLRNAERVAMDRIKIAGASNITATNRDEIVAKLEAAIAAVKAIPYGDA